VYGTIFVASQSTCAQRALLPSCTIGLLVDADHAQQLQVRVNNELVLDAGTCHVVESPTGWQTIVRPPPTTLFRQVLAYLKCQPDPRHAPAGTFVGREGIAATALVLRWGSYLCVLLDKYKPIWSETATTTSRISDQEMARINLEASAALAEWIDFYRQDSLGSEYRQLVERAVCYLPMPQRTTSRTNNPLRSLAIPMVAGLFRGEADPVMLEKATEDAERYPSRVLSNAFINYAWRNGPVEGIHAGINRGSPLDQRRIGRSEERELMRFTTGHMATAMDVCLMLCREQPRRRWPEQVVPYGLASILGITPSSWSLTECSREVCLETTYLSP